MMPFHWAEFTAKSWTFARFFLPPYLLLSVNRLHPFRIRRRQMGRGIQTENTSYPGDTFRISEEEETYSRIIQNEIGERNIACEKRTCMTIYLRVYELNQNSSSNSGLFFLFFLSFFLLCIAFALVWFDLPVCCRFFQNSIRTLYVSHFASPSAVIRWDELAIYNRKILEHTHAHRW